MNSEQFSNLYNIQEYTQPGSQNIEYYSPQPEIFQNDQIISSIQEMLRQRMSENEAVFTYDLLQIFNKNSTKNDNIVSAIELSDKYFKDNY